jgi:hypothetical protein
VSVYVYRLVVTLLEGSTERGWEPDKWAALCDASGWPPINDDLDETSFRWLGRKHYLSGAAANRRADLLRAFGAAVDVERSELVVWPSGETPR